MKLRAAQLGLMIQIFCLIVATTMAAGGGQYPGNSGHLLVYLKTTLFLVPLGSCLLQILTNRILFTDIILFTQKNIFLILFILTLGLSVPLSTFPIFSLQRYLYTIFGFATLFAVAIQYKDTALSIYAKHISAIAAFFLALIAIGGLYGPFDTLRENIQYYGLVHPNMLSSLLAQILLIIAFLRKGLLSCIITALLGVTILMLYSRGVWFSLLATTVICLMADILVFHSKRSFMIMVTGLSVIAFGFLVVLLSPPFGDASLSLFTRNGTIDDLLTLTNRVTLWHNLFDMVSFKQILVGHGYALMAPSVSVDFGSSSLYGAHNAYLSVFLGTGILPCICLIIFIAGVIAVLYYYKNTVPKPLFFLTISSMTLLLTHSFVAEEFGLHVTPTFCLLFLNIQQILKHENLPDRL